MLGLFKPMPGAVGLDLDTGGIRVAELRGTKDSFQIILWEQISLPVGAVKEGVVTDINAVVSALQQLWHQAGIGSRQVVLGICNQGVLMRLINFPAIPRKQLARALWFQAVEYFPIPLDQLVLDYAVVGETSGERGEELEILLVAVQRKFLDQSLQALALAGLKPIIVDASLLALMQVLPQETRYQHVVLIYISQGWGGLLAVAEGIPRLARVFSPNLQPVVNQDAKTDHMEQDTIDVVPTGWVSALVGDVCSTLRYYNAHLSTEPIKAIYISGQGARDAVLADLLQVALGVPVIKINPLKNMSVGTSVTNHGNGDSLEFALSTGLALRGLGA